ncbi:MAG TPA: hypothetical protein PKC85_12210 [Bacteroidia bacterium]|nr:hypothetical protein [Bacteroidia bacterium]HMU20592.1 hypothetical protein [Bacteroidia bacterium]
MYLRLTGLFFLLSLGVAAQDVRYDYVEDLPLRYTNEYSIGATLHSSGWGLMFRKGKNLTVNRKRMYEIEIVSMKHPKEYKSVSYLSERPKTFVFGKMNSLLVIHGGFCYERVLFDKAERKHFEIRWNSTGGPSLGLTKPVYLIFATGNGQRVVEKYDPNNQNHDKQSIYGKAEFTKGLDEMKLYPGVFLKSGVMFEYNIMNDGITAVEVGVMLDAYAKKIPIMAFAKNKQVFFNLYGTFMLGRKK